MTRHDPAEAGPQPVTVTDPIARARRRERRYADEWHRRYAERAAGGDVDRELARLWAAIARIEAALADGRAER